MPNLAIKKERHRVAFSPFLLRCARQLTGRYGETYGTGEILQVRDVTTKVSDLKEYGRLSNTCIDQETAIIGTIYGETKTKLCAVLYVSGNLSVE